MLVDQDGRQGRSHPVGIHDLTAMMRQRFHIIVKGKPWYITVFYPFTTCEVPEIIAALERIECNREDLKRAYDNLSSGQLNNGITFSNYALRESVSVFATSTAPGEYFNLIVHELHHLSAHIALANGFDLDGEEVCYINGDLAQYIHPICKILIA